MQPELTLIAAQQHIADLHRAADQWRFARGGCPPPLPRRLRASLTHAKHRSDAAARG